MIIESFDYLPLEAKKHQRNSFCKRTRVLIMNLMI